MQRGPASKRLTLHQGCRFTAQRDKNQCSYYRALGPGSPDWDSRTQSRRGP
jgi:hypothetical protein